MNFSRNHIFFKPLLVLIGGLLVLHPFANNGVAATLFSETFEGYTSFPTENPTGYNPPDMVNPGIAEISEGADEFWYGVRFQGSGSIDADLAIQQYGGGANETHTGRVSHDSGMVLRIDTTGYQDITLSFNWRTFQAESPDKFTVGYHLGDNLGFATSGANRYLTLTSGAGSWANGWTQILSGSASSTWKTKSASLPSDAGPIYVAFWMNNGHGDFGKFDNILVTGTPIVIPEPTALAMALVGGVAFIARRRFK